MTKNRHLYVCILILLTIWIGPKNALAADTETLETPRWRKLYQIVRRQESSNGTRGLAVTCKRKGMVNEIGYLLYPGFCFDNADHQERVFKKWIERRTAKVDRTDAQLLCYYNTGKMLSTCPYSQGNLANAN